MARTPSAKKSLPKKVVAKTKKKAPGADATLSLADVVASYIKLAKGSREVRSLLFAAHLFAAGKAELGELVVPHAELLTALATSHGSADVRRALVLLGRYAQAADKLEGADALEFSVAAEALVRDGRTDELRALLDKAGDEVYAVLQFGAAGLALLPSSDLEALLKHLADAPRAELLRALPAKIAAPFLALSADLSAEERAERLIDAGRPSEAGAILGSTPTEHKELRWNELRARLGLVAPTAAAEYVARRSLEQPAQIAEGLIRLACALLAGGHEAAAGPLLEEARKQTAADTSQYGQGRRSEFLAWSFALDARVAHARGDAPAVKEAFDRARAEASGRFDLERVAAVALDVPDVEQAFLTVKAMPPKHRSGGGRVGLAFLPDVAGAMRVIALMKDGAEAALVELAVALATRP